MVEVFPAGAAAGAAPNKDVVGLEAVAPVPKPKPVEGGAAAGVVEPVPVPVPAPAPPNENEEGGFAGVVEAPNRPPPGFPPAAEADAAAGA